MSEYAPVRCLVLVDDAGNPAPNGRECGQAAIDYGRNLRTGAIAWAVCTRHDAEHGGGAVVIDERRLPTWQAGLYVAVRDHLSYRLATFGATLSDSQRSTLAFGLLEHLESAATFPVVADWLLGMNERAKREAKR